MAAVLAGWQGPVARLTFEELGADWQGAITRCYAALGLTLSDAALAAMHKVVAASEDSDHRQHAEQLARFSQAG
jgi:hypothetical protein